MNSTPDFLVATCASLRANGVSASVTTDADGARAVRYRVDNVDHTITAGELEGMRPLTASEFIMAKIRDTESQENAYARSANIVGRRLGASLFGAR